MEILEKFKADFCLRSIRNGILIKYFLKMEAKQNDVQDKLLPHFFLHPVCHYRI